MRATHPAHLTLLDITILNTLMQNTNYEVLHRLSITSSVFLVFSSYIFCLQYYPPVAFVYVAGTIMFKNAFSL